MSAAREDCGQLRQRLNEALGPFPSWVHILNRTLLASALASITLLAGCLETSAEGSGAELAKKALSMDLSPAYMAIREQMLEVPCVEESSRTETTKNLKELNIDPIDQLAGSHSHAEIDLHGNMLLDSIHNGKGFVLVDISDPLDMRELGFFRDGRMQLPVRGADTTLDAKFSTNGENAYLAYSDAVAVVDISEPAKPKLVDTEMNPTGYTAQAHMIYPANINGVEYLFVFPSISGIHAVVHKLVGSGPSAKLEFVTMYMYKEPADPLAQNTAPHDGYVAYDPVVEHHLLYTANSFYGVQVINVDDPKNPETLAEIPANADGTPTGAAPTFYHTIQVEWIGDKRIIVTSAEVGYNTLKVFDATDFDDVEFLGQWVFDEQNPTNMQHNLQIVDGILFEAHYGQGLFGFDLNSYVENPTPELPIIFHYQPQGSLWDVVVHKGVAMVSGPGIHVVGYGCFTPGDETLTSDG